MNDIAVPAGLVLCRLEGCEVTVTGLSDASFTVRRDGDSPVSRAELGFLRDDLSGYEGLSFAVRECVSLPRGEARITPEGDGFRAPAMRALRLMARVLRLREEYGEEGASQELTGFEYGGGHEPSFAAQRRKWLAGREMILPAGTELAFALNSPWETELFVREGITGYARAAAEACGMPGLAGARADRVYLGSAYCRFLIPDGALLRAAAARAGGEGLAVTLVLPPAFETEEAIALMKEAGADEAEANSPGLLRALRERGLRASAGRFLTPGRRDPRLKALTENGNALWEDMLRPAGDVACDRYEVYACPREAAAGARYSLHMPFYPLSVSLSCPLEEDIRSAGREAAAGECGLVCRDRARLYPDGLRMAGLGNALFGCPEDLPFVPGPVDRAVWEAML